MKKCKEKGRIYHSPVNYKKETGEKVGAHNVIVRKDTKGSTCETKLITHSRIHAHKLNKKDIVGDSSFLDDKSFVSKETFKSVKRFMRKRNAKYNF